MKKIILALLFFSQISSSSAQQFIKLDSAQLNSKSIAFAKDLALKIMAGQKTKNYYILTETEAEKPMITGFTKDVQENAYKTVSTMFGDFNSLQFSEAWKQAKDSQYIIYRFKGYFNATTKYPEIRVVLSLDNKLAGFFIKPWNEEL